MPSRSVNPIAMAFNILQEYQKAVRDTITASGCSEGLLRKILGDLYATDDVYLSINRPYKREASTFADFCTKHKLHILLKEMFPGFKKSNLYMHQTQAIESILDECTTIISTGTGSGKTESFLVPVLDYCLKHQRAPGIKAVILYPINALAGDQLRRIKEATEQQAITVGSFIGSTPQSERDRMISNPPDILITNYVMLDRLITKERPRSMFERSKQMLRFLVVDEIHYYRGTKGANLCLLLRRLRTLCADKSQLIQIGASATLRQGGGYYSDNDQQQIETFARSLFGQEATQHFRFITPIYDDFRSADSEADPFPATDQAFDGSQEARANPETIRQLADHLAGRQLPHPRPGRGLPDPLYQFAKRNQFLQKMREKLQKKACTIDELTGLFKRVYYDNHRREPRQPKEMVYAYLSLLNELNRRFALDSPSVPEALLDYRLHLILSNLEGSLTRCLRCGQYHDGQRKHCASCNGLLFPVSKKRPDLCLARCNSLKLWPRLHSQTGDTRHTYTVLVQPLFESPSSVETQGSCFAIEPDLEADEDDESFMLRTSRDGSGGVKILRLAEGDWLQELELEQRCLYWQNVQRVVDAVLIKPETKIASKMLGFIDNREKASGIRFRLRDEIAERALTSWASAQWAASEILPLMTAYRRLERQAQQYLQGVAEANDLLGEILQEMPFWFVRMLTRLDEYDSWQIKLEEKVEKSLQADECLLLKEVFLQRGAIDRTAFQVSADSGKLKHFFLEKYRVATEYGVGLASAKEAGYDVVSLGEQGQIYQHMIERLGATRIENLLSTFHDRGLLICKHTRGGTPFYQLLPERLILACSSQQAEAASPELSLALIECHTADHTSKERADYEQRFSKGMIQALICTPTLELGVDIGDLTCVAMIGFPPSPANYAQRAGRAGRTSTLRSATIIVLSSSGSNYDAYYVADPRKMIDGTISPPQFALANTRLLAAHIYAHLLAGKHLSLLKSREQLRYRLERCIANDELDLRPELGHEYEKMAAFLHEDIRRIPALLTDHEQGYRRGFFPDYGFRKDGIPLLDPAQPSSESEDSEEGVFTRREPEEAVRKLAPGRIVYCGGRPVRVNQNQSGDTYDIATDPEGHPFRAYKHLVAEEKDEQYIYARREADAFYLVRRKLRIREPVSELRAQGPGYCRIHPIRKGTLYLVNEGAFVFGEGEPGLASATPFHDQHGDYHVGASLTRDGLLLSLSEQILPPDTRANFLAVLLRSIPDYFNLDDGELRIASNVELFSSDAGARDSGQKYIFLYGHDEGGLVPLERIFEHLPMLLNRHLQVLESCSCDDDGCYHCLFSFNSQYLAGILSRQQAAAFLRTYLGISLLQPHILQKTVVPAQPDVLLKVEWRGRSEVKAENRLTKTTRMYVSEESMQDQNTAIYTTINTALLKEAAGGARSVQIICNPPYIHDQLQGKAKVTKGQEAFFQVMLTLRTWENWTSTPERGR